MTKITKKPSVYNVGDYVLIKKPIAKSGEDNKFKQKFRGPYIVDKVLGSNRYRIKDIPGFTIIQTPVT